LQSATATTTKRANSVVSRSAVANASAFFDRLLRSYVFVTPEAVRRQLKRPTEYERRNKCDDKQKHDAARQPIRRANISKTVLATSVINHAATRYSPAKRITLRRFSSEKKDVLSA
jgi:hypothetical protein